MTRTWHDETRAAVRWIGDAHVLEGNIETGAPAVWRAPDGTTRCARVRLGRRMTFWGPDEQELAGFQRLAGENIVPLLAVHHTDDQVALIEDDVADLSLHDVIEATRNAYVAGAPPIGLALYVASSCARAHDGRKTNAPLTFVPQDIAVAWDGHIHLRARLRDLDVGDSTWREWNDDPPHWRYPDSARRAVGIVMHELLAGRHPIDEKLDDDPLAQDLTRLPPVDGVPRRVAALARELMAVDPPRGPRALRPYAARITTLAHAHPFSAHDLAGMLRGLFDDAFRQSSAQERDDRLRVPLAPGVVREPWR